MANFKVKLAKRLELDETWELALVRFSFTHSLCTFNKIEEVHIVGVNNGVRSVIQIPPMRLRDIKHLILAIQTIVKRAVNISEEDLLPDIEVNSFGAVMLINGQINDEPVKFEFSEGLDIILGVHRRGFYYLNAFLTDFYVYADCVKHRIVGDVSAPLLTTLDIGNLALVPGKQMIFKIKDPEYYQISVHSIDEIEIQILDDTGREPSFDYGVVNLTLHLRQRE